MISIVIPAREEEREIERMVRQFEALEYPHEVIVSDGRSLDRTVVFARSCGARIVESADGVRSPSRQRNDGARVAGGEYLLFADCTVVLPDVNAFVERALQCFERDPQLVGLSTPQWVEPHLETWADRIMLTIGNALWIFRNNFLKDPVASGKFQMIRRDAFEYLGGYREDLIAGEDHDMFMRLAQIGATRIEPSIHILYAGRREHAWGWPRLLWHWTFDKATIALTDKCASEDWVPVR